MAKEKLQLAVHALSKTPRPAMSPHRDAVLLNSLCLPYDPANISGCVRACFLFAPKSPGLTVARAHGMTPRCQ